MPSNISITSLHLRYRLWIAEMNADITILRILSDYLQDHDAKKEQPELNARIEYFQGRFIDLRKDLDELKHEMHLIKMKLGADSRETRPLDFETYQKDNHAGLEERYLTFRKKFDNVKDEFKNFEGRWQD